MQKLLPDESMTQSYEAPNGRIRGFENHSHFAVGNDVSMAGRQC